LIALAAMLGYLVGSAPTAGLLGRLWGVDLRTEGSGNPGTHNALRTVGPALAAVVLMVEAVKGLGATLIGGELADDAGMVAAGLGAVAGNVYNVWYRMRGGKGLGISFGVMLGAWPIAVAPVVLLIASAAVITRSAGLAALTAIAGLIVLSAVWVAYELPTGGASPDILLVVFAWGLAALLSYKHWRDSPLNPRWRSRSRESVSPGRH